MKAEASGSFLKRAMYYRNTTKLFIVHSRPSQEFILCGIMGRPMYAESGAEIHIGFNLLLVTRVITRFQPKIILSRFVNLL
jgi:hypothetical protein